MQKGTGKRTTIEQEQRLANDQASVRETEGSRTLMNDSFSLLFTSEGDSNAIATQFTRVAMRTMGSKSFHSTR